MNESIIRPAEKQEADRQGCAREKALFGKLKRLADEYPEFSDSIAVAIVHSLR